MGFGRARAPVLRRQRSGVEKCIMVFILRFFLFKGLEFDVVEAGNDVDYR